MSIAFLREGCTSSPGRRGLLTVYSTSDLAWISDDPRAHRRGARTRPDVGGEVVSGGWDKSVAVLEAVHAPLPRTRCAW